MIEIPLANLRPHPRNSNVMPADRLAKLAAHIRRTGLYPPLIVRKVQGDVCQVLDGHHRWAALSQIGAASARCDVWDVDDAQALVLLATLNRLSGDDDPRKRGELLGELADRLGPNAAAIARLLPETAEQSRRLIELCRRAAPKPLPAPRIDDLPAAVCFFLTAPQRRRLDTGLQSIGGPRDEALMRLVDAAKGGV